jgi:putative cell wall-binding protein/low affinity Fe/Cu permease
MRRKLRKPLAILLAFAMMFCLVPAMGFAADDGDNSVKRLSGQNRYETAANIAEDAFPDGAGAVVIANGEPALDYADALAGSFLAGAADAPILLTNAAQLPDATAKAIEKLGATKAYVLGGELAVSNAVVSQLEKLLDEVERVEGQNRFETAVNISKVGKNLPGAEININTALIANGTRPADALAAGAYANAQGIPVLLVNQNNIPAATKAALAGIENTFVIGGNLVVSDDVASELDATRISGRTRNATSVAVAETLWESPENFALVNGADGIVDALAGSVLGMPILYVPSEDVDAYLNKVITGNSFGFILGGVNRISDEFLNEVQQMIEGVEEELQVESVSAINANTISVTFEGMEPVEVTLETALVHGQTEVTFSYEEVEYTATLKEAYVDPEVDAAEKLAAATEAVEVAEESELQEDLDVAMTLVEALPEGEAKDDLVARLAVVQEAIDERVAAEEALAEATEAVVVAEESLLEADLAAAQGLVDALEASDAKTLLQARINSVQLQIQGIIAAVNNANTEVKLYNALNIKPFVNVDVEKIRDYDTALAARNFTTIAAIQTIIDTVNANAFNTDITALVNNADTAVQAAETTPNGLVGGSGPKTLIEKAQEEIDKLPTEIPEAVATALNVNVTVKADLQERLDAVKVVVPVLEATNQIELLAALENKAFDRVNEDLIATYESDLDGSQKTVVAIQGAIDAANLTAAQTAVTAAETSPLTAAKVATAQVLVNYLPEDVAPATTKADLQDRLDVVTALIAVADATTEAELLAALENEVLGLTDVNPAAIAEYKEEIDDNNADITTAAKVQANVVNAGNTAALNAAVTDITTNFGTYDETKAEDQAKALKELNRLADVSDLDKDTIDADLIEQYIVAIAADLNSSSSTIDGSDDPAAIQALINGVNAVKEETLRLAAVNAATDAYEMRTALTAVAIAESDGYVDLTSQEKLEVSELVLVVRANETDEKFANTTAVTTAISTATSARTAFLGKVNAATTISGMVTALDVAEFPEFQDLGDLEQVEVAELVLNALNELKADDPTAEFETIAEIKAAAGL